MKATLPEPERWCDAPHRGTTAENEVGAAFKRVREATLPSDTTLARVARRLEAPPRARTTQLVLRVGLATALVIATGGVVGAALNKWRQAGIAAGRRATPTSDASAMPPATRQARRGHAGRAAADDLSTRTPPEAATESALEAAAVLTPPAAENPGPLVVAPPASNVGTAARPTVPPADPSEAAVLAGAFRELRTGGDAAGALRSLDQYDRRFPAGGLRGEARIARAEALIALDRRSDALPWLEGIENQGGTLTRDVRITRGELLAEAGRCAGAVVDFDAVLSVTERDAAGGRALYGRASCRLLAGDIGAARADLGHYLRLHPHAAFAPSARRIMDLPP